MRAFWPDPKVITEERLGVLYSTLWVTGLEPNAELGATGWLLTMIVTVVCVSACV